VPGETKGGVSRHFSRILLLSRNGGIDASAVGYNRDCGDRRRRARGRHRRSKVGRGAVIGRQQSYSRPWCHWVPRPHRTVRGGTGLAQGPQHVAWQRAVDLWRGTGCLCREPGSRLLHSARPTARASPTSRARARKSVAADRAEPELPGRGAVAECYSGQPSGCAGSQRQGR
jgi:hypothetical protein